MISGLNQLPSFLPFLTEESFQPAKASLKGIVGQTVAILIAFDPWPCPPAFGPGNSWIVI